MKNWKEEFNKKFDGVCYMDNTNGWEILCSADIIHFIEELLKQQKEELLKELKLDSRYKTDSSWFKNSFDDCRALGHEDGWNEAVDDLNNKIDNLKDKSYFQDNKRLEDIS